MALIYRVSNSCGKGYCSLRKLTTCELGARNRVLPNAGEALCLSGLSLSRLGL